MNNDLESLQFAVGTLSYMLMILAQHVIPEDDETDLAYLMDMHETLIQNLQTKRPVQ